MLNNKKGFSIYKIISIVALLALFFVLALPQFFNLNKKEKTEECIKNMKTIRNAVKNYLNERQEDFDGDTIDLLSKGYLKKSYECPENGIGDKYYIFGDYETGEIIIKCANEKDHHDHVLKVGK